MLRGSLPRLAGVQLLVLLLGSALAPAPAAAVALAADYLLIGTGDEDEVGTSIAVSNFALGRNDAPVPMPGLTLVEPIPADTLPVPTGIPDDGDLAVTDPGGTFDFSDVAIHGAFGVRCAPSAAACNDGASNTTFDGVPFPAQGLVGGFDFAPLRSALAAARSQIASLPRDLLLDFPGGDWTLNRIDLAPGLTVFDIDTGGDDLLLENRNVVIDGPPGARAIFRVPDDANFLISQAALLLGTGGIAPGDVLFFSQRPDDDSHFDFSSALVNGVAFWDLGDAGGEVGFSNVQGCTQVIGDKLNLSNVRLTRCAFLLEVPEPAGASVAALAALALLARRRSFGRA